jgi:uroporphyrinogen decarboxylase
MLKNDRLIKALLGQAVDKTPVWLMRQAGRYLPEYRALRQEAGDFLTLCKTPELACEATLQPLARFDLDAAIIFSDILTIPDAMGLGLQLVEKQGPVFDKPIKSRQDISKLSVPDPHDRLAYVTDAIRLSKKALNNKVPLIGFAGSPWTLAAYMIEGHGSKTFTRAKSLLYADPKAAHELLDKLAQATTLYLNAQIAAGANAVMIFDTWGGLLSPHYYQEFSLRYMQQIMTGLTRQYNGQTVPVTLFTKGGGPWLKVMADSGCDALGVDWTYDLAQAKEQVAGKVALQGNLDPIALLGSPEAIKQDVIRILQTMKNYPGFVFNLGHGLVPETPPEHVGLLVDWVHG